jgi:hypothetical protein
MNFFFHFLLLAQAYSSIDWHFVSFVPCQSGCFIECGSCQWSVSFLWDTRSSHLKNGFYGITLNSWLNWLALRSSRTEYETQAGALSLSVLSSGSPSCLTEIVLKAAARKSCGWTVSYIKRKSDRACARSWLFFIYYLLFFIFYF